MAARRKPAGPSPWLVFVCSLLGAPVVSLATGYVAAQINVARIEERLGVIGSRQAEFDGRLANRIKDADARLERMETGLRANDVQTGQIVARMEGLQREVEAADKRSAERNMNVVESIRRLQDRMLRPMDGTDPFTPLPGHAILRQFDN